MTDLAAAPGPAVPAAPTVGLPKGGGAIRGVGETFAANPQTGTGSLTVPVPTSPGRNGFGPSLALTYDSGSGNGPFGFGWALTLPAISRRTDKGLPRYLDTIDSDRFVLAGAEELVPAARRADDGQWVARPPATRIVDGTTYTVRRYRPRTEGLFARIERWDNTTDPADVFWRSISRENITTWYGRTAESRIVDPADPTRVFSWLVSQTHDDKGNVAVHHYKAENSERILDAPGGAGPARAHERNRTPASRSAQRYVKSIRYGNRTPYHPVLDAAGPWPAPDETAGAWMFEVVFDYGEHDGPAPTPSPDRVWPTRPDPFSTYRPGFEVRTYRTCRRVLVFHHFPDEAGVGDDCLVRSLDLRYGPGIPAEDPRDPVYSFLGAVETAGYVRTPGGYRRSALPPVEFEYAAPVVDDVVRTVARPGGPGLPIPFRSPAHRWVDLHGDGTGGILGEHADTWYYERNLSPLTADPQEADARISAVFDVSRVVADKPNVRLADGAEFLDLAGDGTPDVVMLTGPAAGLYEHDDRDGWTAWRPLRARPTHDLLDPDVRFVDLDGDGLADILITADDVVEWQPSLGEDGYGPARRIQRMLDEEHGPRLLFSDRTQVVQLADMSGDGLADLVRVRHGDVCYWPNLGHGRFGAKVTMDTAPLLDHPDLFDPVRVRLADIDGSGTADLVHLGADGVRLFFNQSGNGWSAAHRLDVFPGIDELSGIDVVDLLGNGTACMVWTSPLPGAADSPTRYVDLMGGRKPHLLTGSRNNLGARARVDYAPTTTFALRDELAGIPWVTRLPFPLHVVERVVTIDEVSGNRFTSRYTYHHGHYDGVEREFRGFGMVEQRDTERFAAVDPGADPAASHVPPVLTKTWFHTGIHLGRDRVSDHLAGEYYRAPGATAAQAGAGLLPDTVLPPGLTSDEERQACRALRGAVLRQEVFAEDADATSTLVERTRSATPYTVTEQNFTVVAVQGAVGTYPGVFVVHPRESLRRHHEREAADPRTEHTLTLQVDDFGNVLRSVEIGYGRRTADPALLPADYSVQATTLITAVAATFTGPVDDDDRGRAPLPAETRTFELTGFVPGAGDRFAFEEFAADDFAAVTDAQEIAFDAEPHPTLPQKRLVQAVRTRYRSDDLAVLLPLGAAQSLGLHGVTYELALTPDLLSRVLVRRRAGQPDEPLLTAAATVALLESRTGDGGGFVAWDGGWWAPSARQFFDPAVDIADPSATAAAELAAARAGFFAIRLTADSFDQSATVDYDTHRLLPVRTVDAVGNAVSARHDYRVLQPREVTDPNGNRTAAAYDPLGLVVATAVMGKPGEAVGDRLEGFASDADTAALRAFTADPSANAAAMLGRATTRVVYDVDRFRRTGQPVFAAALTRETHFEPARDDVTAIDIDVVFSDGFGREIQHKIQAESGPAPLRAALLVSPDGDVRPGDLVLDAQGSPVTGDVDGRWVGTGRVVYDTKGRPVKEYEPFFSATHLFESERELTDTGVSPVLLYDPIGRVVARLLPDDTYEKVVLGAWRHAAYDGNDTCAPRGDQTGDPRTDPDIGGYVRRYTVGGSPGGQTWYARRAGGALGPAERDAAVKAAAHAATPTVSHVDSLGRVFLTVLHNRFDRDGVTVDEQHATRFVLDIEGLQRQVRDALTTIDLLGGGTVTDPRGRTVVRRTYDLRGELLHEQHADAGERWMLADVVRGPVRRWDGRGFARRLSYDAARRPVSVHVRAAGTERLAERTDYGEAMGDQGNHRGRVHRHLDAAGVVTHIAYDFKGNLLSQRRDLRRDHRSDVDWSVAQDVGTDSFTTRMTFDARDRPVTAISPDGSVYRATFNRANLLERVDVRLRGAAQDTAFVTEVDYDAQGRRRRVVLGNGVTTDYEYDPLTFRLRRVRTTRPATPDVTASQVFADPSVLQDLGYTYDPVGNLTTVEDAALPVLVYGGQVVEPRCGYRYDAVYRLVEATGREHIGQNAWDLASAGGLRDFPFAGVAHPDDLQAMRTFVQRFDYDAVGNLRRLAHRAGGGGWTRRYDYREPSLLEPGLAGNRLTRTATDDGIATVESYAYDAHGNTVRTSVLGGPADRPNLHWDDEDRLVRADLGGGGTAYYVYDSAGQRVRKVVESLAGVRQRERLWIGGFEVYREYAGDTVRLERETLHVMDDRNRVALVDTLTVDSGLPLAAPTAAIRYQLADHLGSSSVELDSAGALIAYESYHPYGTTAFQAGRTAAEVRLRRYRYAGKERDEETGLVYFGARYYAPWLGRWLSADPKGVETGVNAYLYVAANPVRLIDPDGHDWRDSLSVTQRAALWVDDRIQESAVARGIVKNLEKRGEALIKAPAAIAEKFEKEGALGIAKSTWEGAVHLVTDTGSAVVDVAENASAAFSGDEAAKEKVASRTLDIVLNVADMVTLADGVGAAKSAAVTGGKAVVAGGKSVATTIKEGTAVLAGGTLVPAEGVVASGKALAMTTKGGATLANDTAKATALGISQMSNLANTKAPVKSGGGGGSGSGKGPKPKVKDPYHHIATDKNRVSTARGGPWTPRYEKFFKGAGLDISKAKENLVRVAGHAGPHPADYHRYVLTRLETATRGLRPGTKAFREAVIRTLNDIARKARTPGTKVNDWLTKK